ncbi:PEGA domain-containing protein [Corallococcus praedator]|uniref:PEGA domain-containing protein n=1 Tax=Corallococcus praedator TaxID=2316724 RepID=A0ABX9QJQ0_9BACT|nr:MULTISPECIES: serine/threonine-protein kinase [Corallococcus]RKH21085.1 PEGA domain-containing protein [Corallococcus sp. CA047B]RKH32952.1 PEGA domain-containing protein [Corallococcus sp. CA031C]RKI07677.1 PEGA domain-containing protein [Corallococcus praedator]
MVTDDLFAHTVLSGHGDAVSDGGGTTQALMAQPGEEVQEGTVLGNYQLERLLGEGSMGRVFQARHVRLGRQVALKVLRPEHARDSSFVQRFFQEARTVNQINHEHIVEVFDFVDDSPHGHVYCVMELLRGQNLGALLKEEGLTLARVQRMAVQVCAALGAAHQVGVVHRDIKPDNLFISQRSGQSDFVKVLDFGVAKLMTTQTGVSLTGTLDGTIIGTPAYMAPEQAAGLPVDARADIYAVGNILYEMLSGHPPFQASAFGQLVVQIITQPPPPLPSHLPSGEPMPPALAALVMRCLAKEPEARPQQLAEVTTALLLLPAVTAAPSALSPVEELERPTLRMRVPSVLRDRRLQVSAALAALALVSGITTWKRLHPSRSPEADVVQVEGATAAASGTVAGANDAVTLTVHSSPPGAKVVRVDTGEELGVTPLTKALARRAVPSQLRVELAGYVPLERAVELKQDAAAAELTVPLVKASAGPRRAPARGPGRKGGSRDAVIDPFAAH